MTEILDHLLRSETSSTLFQPIYDLRGELFEVWAVEALTRGPAGTHFEPAPIFFEYARLRHEEVRVDRWCIANAFARHAARSANIRLTVNVHATTLERDAAFPTFIESAAVANCIDPAKVIIEIVEASSYFDSARTQSVLRGLRALGASIAIDDLGLGHANFRTILDTHPEYLKIDRYFVNGLVADARRQSLVASAVRIAQDFGALVIGEGVEDPADVDALREMNVPLAQGYLLAMPAAEPNLAPIGAERLRPQTPLRSVNR